MRNRSTLPTGRQKTSLPRCRISNRCSSSPATRASLTKARASTSSRSAASGAHLWADRFDGSLEDIFGLQDQVTASVVGAVAPKLEEAEIERAHRKPTEMLDAYDYYLRGLAVVAP